MEDREDGRRNSTPLPPPSLRRLSNPSRIRRLLQRIHHQPTASPPPARRRLTHVRHPDSRRRPVLPVGKTEDIAIKRVESDGPDVLVRVFTPETPAPEGGYGVMLYMHGGGWVLGNINTENTVCTNICKRAGVVVVSVDYRYIRLLPLLFISHDIDNFASLAPENPFPAAVHDCWEALLWLQDTAAAPLYIDLSKSASAAPPPAAT